jgi:hypothetical protein
MSKIRFTMSIVLLLSLALAACGKTPEPTPVPAASGAGLKITGKVDAEMNWTEAEVRTMDTMEAESTNKEGQTSTYTGVSVNALLEEAGLQGDAATLVFVADDGYSAEVALSEVQACQDCIVSFRNQGGFSTVMPGFSGKLQVKGVVEIQVK